MPLDPAYIDTLRAIATTAMTAGNLTNVNALAVTDGTFEANETIRTTKISQRCHRSVKNSSKK